MKKKFNTYSIKGSVEHIESDLSTYTIQPDLDYLKSILSLRRYSSSKAQDDFADDLEEFYTKKGAVVERDEYGNVYVTKGDASLYPCMVAHTDINQDKRDNVSIMISGDIIFGFDNDEAVQCGIGADDGCGIALAYEMFNRFDAIKLFFPKDEEIGLKGTYASDPTFFTDCSMILQGDRRSYTTDLITYTNGIETCSKEFVLAADDIMLKYGYSENRGVATDIGGLKKDPIIDCIACNLSIGYFNEHSDEEVISIKAYYNAVNFVYELIKDLGSTKWHHVYTPKIYSTSQYDLFNTPFENNSSTYKKESSYVYDDTYHSIYDSLYLDSPFKDKIGKSILNKDIARNINIPYNAYLLQKYPMLKDEAKRQKLLSSWDEDGALVSDSFDQDAIDHLLSKGVCPYCSHTVEITNELLLDVTCGICFCTFNVVDDGELF